MKINLFWNIKNSNNKNLLKKDLKKLSLNIQKQKIFNLLYENNKINFNIIITNSKKIKQMNKIYRKINKKTDVLTFSDIPNQIYFEKNSIQIKTANSKQNLLNYSYNSDIYISYQVAKKQALEHKLKLSEELLILSIHGILHSIGLDHERTKKEKKFMKKKEQLLLSKIISKEINSLIN